GRFAECGIAEINRVETESKRGRAASDVPPVAKLAVAHSPAGAQHGLVIEPVSDCEPRAKGVWIGLREIAIASPGAVAFINERSPQSSCRRIRRSEIDHAAAVMQFVPLPGVIPPQSVIQGQFGRGLPVVLSVKAPGFLPPLDLLGGGDGGGV